MELETLDKFLNDLWDTLEGVFRGNISQETRDIWKSFLEKCDRGAIFKSVQEICKREDRMPSLAKILHYVRVYTKIELLSYKTGFDEKGTPCVYWSDAPRTPAYRATHCPEGKQFLALLAQFAGKSYGEIEKLFTKWTVKAGVGS